MGIPNPPNTQKIQYFEMNKLKKTLVLLSLGAAVGITTQSVALAQQSFGGTPLTLSGNGQLRGLSDSDITEGSIYVPLDFNVDDAMAMSDWTTARLGQPLRIGNVINLKAPANFAQQASLVATLGDTEVYRMVLTTDDEPHGAILYYNDFFIPEGGKLYIYNQDADQILGAYTHETHPRHGSFATEPIAASTIIMEYEAPKGTPLPSVEVEALGYLFQGVPMAATGKDETEIDIKLDFSDPYPSRACQVNVNCPDGADWQDEKAGIVSLMQRIYDGNSTTRTLINACSGTVMNNTQGDFKPYILSAAHCAGEPKGATKTEGAWKGEFKIHQSIMNQWIFGFHYERPRCSNGNTATYNTRTQVGATCRVYTPIYGHSDGMLLELLQEIPEDYRVYYNGFDATPNLPTKGVGMHHPAGDSKKISTYDGGVGYYTWVAKDSQGGTNDHFILKFATGATEGGSSGSSLFNENKLVVGALTGGETVACSGRNMYGRMSAHWDKYKDKGDMYNMAKYLDPKNGGTTKVLEGTWRNNFQPLQTIKGAQAAFKDNGANIELTWDALPAHPQGYAVSYLVYRGKTKLQEVTTTTFTDALTEEMEKLGALHYSIVPQYEIDGAKVATAPAYVNIYVGPITREITEITTTANSNGGVDLKWNEPINAQLISKTTDMFVKKYLSVAMPALNATYVSEMWYTDRWRTEKFGTTDPVYVSQINFVPAQAGITYQLLIHQRGKAPMIELVDIPADASIEEVYRHKLRNPYKVDPNQMLQIGYKIPSARLYPIRVVNNSMDDEYATDGSRLTLYLDGATGKELYDGTYSVAGLDVPRSGYLALDPVFTASSVPLTTEITQIWSESKLPAPFPKRIGFKVYRDGTLITGDEPISSRYYTDPEGSTGAKYTIEVVYDYPSALNVEGPTTKQSVYAYPAHFTTELHLNNAALVERARVYDLQGRLVVDMPGAETIDVSTLASGNYLLILTTPSGEITQKVTKK